MKMERNVVFDVVGTLAGYDKFFEVRSVCTLSLEITSADLLQGH